MNNKRNYPSQSEYESGNVELNNEQLKILKSISIVLSGTSDKYDTLPNTYSAKGLNAALKNQINTKLESGAIFNTEAERARNLINIFKKTLE